MLTLLPNRGMGGGGGRSAAYGGIPAAPEPSSGAFSGFDNGEPEEIHSILDRVEGLLRS